MTEDLYEYMANYGVREPEILKQLRAETAQLPNARMQISPEEGQFLSLLVKLIGAKRTLEVGVFTGYSSLWTALALPSDGKITACDVNAEWTTMAQRYWQQAGVAGKITLHLAPAQETLDRLIQEKNGNTFDFAFIDADKPNYNVYYERCLALVRPGGLIALDNMFMHGAVVQPGADNAGARAIDALNQKIHNDNRVEPCLVPVADGVMLAQKK
jgi:predicted O-methyltransferase YrrM